MPLVATDAMLNRRTNSAGILFRPLATGALALDPQLVCYSWVTGIADVAHLTTEAYSPNCGLHLLRWEEFVPFNGKHGFWRLEQTTESEGFEPSAQVLARTTV
jgi:hypothetical protein